MKKLSDIFRQSVYEALLSLDNSFSSVTPESFRPLNSGGLAHDHVLISGTDWLLRIPRGNQLGMEPDAFLDLQTACFSNAALSGVCPPIIGALPPAPELPDGALIVKFVSGRPAFEKGDAAAVAKAMSSLHKITAESVKGLHIEEHPFGSQIQLLENVFGAAASHTHLSDDCRELLDNKRIELISKLRDRENDKTIASLPMRLIGGDSHTGNFMIDRNNKAWLVDVEFALIDTPYIDIADACHPLPKQLMPGNKIWDAKTLDHFHETYLADADEEIVKSYESGLKLAYQVVGMRTLLWLSDWKNGGQKDILHRIPETTRANFDALANRTLTIQGIKAALEPQNP